eukprot:13830830-Alexandrium_andersonii.AAC.1
MINKGWQAYVDRHNVPSTAVSFKATYAIEFNNAAIEGILALPEESRPDHIFTNILDFTPQHLRKSVGLDGGPELESAELRKLLPKCRTRRSLSELMVCHAT